MKVKVLIAACEDRVCNPPCLMINFPFKPVVGDCVSLHPDESRYFEDAILTDLQRLREYSCWIEGERRGQYVSVTPNVVVDAAFIPDYEKPRSMIYQIKLTKRGMSRTKRQVTEEDYRACLENVLPF